VPEKPQQQNDDPITSSSLAVAILVSSFLLVLSLAWALYDEMVGLRPWRSYQTRFIAAYEKYLDKQIPLQQKREMEVEQSAEFKQLSAALQAAREAARPRLEQIDREMALVNRQVAAVSDAFTISRGKVTALIYDMELAEEKSSSRQSRLKDVEEARAETQTVELPAADGSVQKNELNFTQLEAEFNRLKNEKARLTLERVSASRQASDLQLQLDTFRRDKMIGLGSGQLRGLLRAAQEMPIEIIQVNVNPANPTLNNMGSGGLVDRCQSCHISTDPKIVPPIMVLTKANLGMARSTDAPFASHPEPDLIKLHPTDKFGCSPCHGGNGRAVSSVEKGHGRYKHWLWPLYYPENYNSGCQTCHVGDAWTAMAPVLNQGKELFRLRGCIGCHKFQGFDDQGEQLLAATQSIRQLEKEKRDTEAEIPRVNRAADEAPDNPTAQKLLARAINLTQSISTLDARLEQFDIKSRSLLREDKKVGPSLKEVRMKLRKEWVPYWIGHTRDFRPATKMPQFRLSDDEIKAISAFIWQSGVTGPALAKQPPGDAARGKASLETRGCLACHSIGEGKDMIGGDFAANLSRVGEKANYDYLVRWVHNPRVRTRPYCPYEKRDLGPEDYKKHGLPFIFDLEHSECPNDGHQLQVQQQTVMPSLRLSNQESRDIASFLMTQKRSGASYAAAAFVDDPQLKDIGKALVKNYGCAGCHEIATLEDEGRIGTELTTEGSKPVDRLDFALLTEKAKRGHLPDGKPARRGGQSGVPWYDAKGFIEQKLTNPAIFDQGKSTPLLKMPQPNVSPQEINALTTMLVGSVDAQLPPEYLYRPAGFGRDVQDGWWVVTKYNCMGCHQVAIGQQSALQSLPQYQGDEKFKLPPPLVGEGARVDPNWLAHFLENPAMSKTDTNRNGVRNYLQVRMPTFYLSDNEIQKLVRFFAGMSVQSTPYIPPRLAPLTDAERAMARALFTHPAAPCLKCHATGNPAHDKDATAPNFLLARERLKPGWTQRWITEPAKIAPGTAMPSGLFRREGERWVFNGPLPASISSYPRDHADLLVRYMFQMTPQEQAALLGRTPSSVPAPGGR